MATSGSQPPIALIQWRAKVLCKAKPAIVPATTFIRPALLGTLVPPGRKATIRYPSRLTDVCALICGDGEASQYESDVRGGTIGEWMGLTWGYPEWQSLLI